MSRCTQLGAIIRTNKVVDPNKEGDEALDDAERSVTAWERSLRRPIALGPRCIVRFVGEINHARWIQGLIPLDKVKQGLHLPSPLRRGPSAPTCHFMRFDLPTNTFSDLPRTFSLHCSSLKRRPVHINHLPNLQ